MADEIPAGVAVRASHVLIKHAGSRNPISRRTNESTAGLTQEDAEAEMAKWVESLDKDDRPLAEKFAALAYHRSDCGSFAKGGDLGDFRHGEMQRQFEQAACRTPVGECSKPFSSDSGIHILYRTK